jgi:hypothetical protein
MGSKMKNRFPAFITFIFAIIFCLQIPTWFFVFTSLIKPNLVLHVVLSAGSGIFLGYLTGLQLRQSGSKIIGFGDQNILRRFIWIAIVGLLPLLLILLPNLNRLGPRAYDVDAKSAGRNATIAEENFYRQAQEKTGEGQYTSDLNELVRVDKNLTDDPLIIFVFFRADASGFSLTTEKPYRGKSEKYYWSHQGQ